MTHLHQRGRRGQGGISELIAKIESVFDLLPVAMAIAYGPECSRIRANAPLRAILGVRGGGRNISKSADTGVDLPFRVYRNGVEARPEELPMQVCAREGSAVNNSLCEIHRQDGAIVILQGSVQPWLGADGARLGSIGVFFDISEAQDELHRLRAVIQRSGSLGPLVRICASCRRIAEGESWSSFEQFLEHACSARFSHGLCPDCFKRAMATLPTLGPD